MSNQEVSWDPDDAQEGGGGLLQKAEEATLTFEATVYDYNGSVAVPVPSLHVHGEYKDENGEDATFDEYYSAGDASKLRPKKDGSRFEAISEGAGLTKSCKAMQLINSIVSANGGDKSILTTNIRDLDGIVVNMERKPDIDRPGLSATNDKGRKRTIMLVTEIVSLPGEAKPKGKAKPGAKPAAKAKANPLKDRAVEVIKEILEGVGGEIEAENLPQVLFRKLKKDPDVKKLVEMASDEDFLGAIEGVTLEDGTLKLDED